MKKILAVSLCFMSGVVSAEIIRVKGIDLEFVTIGNPGNPGDTRSGLANPAGCGAVDYTYQIGKYEITASQWQTINTVAGIGVPGCWNGDQPTACISWYDAARFCNYLTTGNTETGVYSFTSGSLRSIMDHRTARSVYGRAYFLPTENEWYKAAYYKPDGSGYSLYANGLTWVYKADNGWNYCGGKYSSPWDVGMGTLEQNGTKDIMGNVWEWNETLLSGSLRGIRGGSYDSLGSYFLESAHPNYYDPDDEYNGIGFRVAFVPEPASLVLLGLGGLALRGRKM